MEFDILAGVYDTGVDTQLMIEAVRSRRGTSFLEVGCGCGAISLVLARQFRSGVGVDINPAAVENAEHNRSRLGISNVVFGVSDVFEGVDGVFDVIVCNPPYNHHPANDVVDRMFWDPNDSMKTRFFGGVRRYLAPSGRVFFGWANFADLDPSLPVRLSRAAGLKHVRHWSRRSGKGIHDFLVFEFRA